MGRPDEYLYRQIGVSQMDESTLLTQAHGSVTKTLDAGVGLSGLRSVQLLKHGTMKVYFYEPRGEDQQLLHDQDEVYIVMAGSGTFAIGCSEDALKRIPFGPGDAIFTPAGAVHRFEDFTDDVGTWVIMWGPQGGEKTSSQSYSQFQIN